MRACYGKGVVAGFLLCKVKHSIMGCIVACSVFDVHVCMYVMYDMFVYTMYEEVCEEAGG